MYDPKRLYIDPILTGFSVGYQEQTLVGERIFPVTPVKTKSGKYRVFDRSSWKIFEDRREPGTVANEVAGGKWSEDTFSIYEHSLQAAVLDEEREDLASQGGLDNPVWGGDLQLDPEMDAVALVTRSLLLGHEKKVTDLALDVNQYPSGHHTTLTSSAQWDDWTPNTSNLGDMPDSDPVADVKAGMKVIYKDTGRYPNTIVFSWDAWNIITDHPRIVDRFKAFTLTEEDAFRQLTGFKGNIYVAESRYNQANNIDQAEDLVELWGQDVWMGIVDPIPGQRTQTFGKTFAKPYPDGSLRPTDRWREDPRKADLFRVSWNYDLKMVSGIAGYLIKDAVSAN